MLQLTHVHEDDRWIADERDGRGEFALVATGVLMHGSVGPQRETETFQQAVGDLAVGDS